MNGYNKKIIEELKKRYSHNNKTIGHFGDCGFYSVVGICDCGLFRDLIYIGYDVPKKLYPDFDKDLGQQEKLKEKYRLINNFNISTEQIESLIPNNNIPQVMTEKQYLEKIDKLSKQQQEEVSLPLIDAIYIDNDCISVTVIPPDWLFKQEKISIDYDKTSIDYKDIKEKIDKICKKEYCYVSSKSIPNISYIVHGGNDKYTLCYTNGKTIEIQGSNNKIFPVLKEIAQKAISDITSGKPFNYIWKTI